MAKSPQLKILFGLKIRQLRMEKSWSFDDLYQRSGISKSYLNEIEKGKKFPQPENLEKLAAVFEVEVSDLQNPRLQKQFAPIHDLIESNFLAELPLELFKIDLQEVVEIMAKAPEEVNAFISAILEIARNYSLAEEHFFKAALRAYQEMHLNYFEKIEKIAEDFVKEHDLSRSKAIEETDLVQILTASLGYTLDDKSLGQEINTLAHLRSVFLEKQKKLLLNPRLNPRQRTYQLAKELGFHALHLQTRPKSSALIKVSSFTEVLNNYLASYFAVAMLIGRESFKSDLAAFFNHPTWSPNHLLFLLEKYKVSPEVLFQRFNLMTQIFPMKGVFFFRFIHDTARNSFKIDKELHLNRRNRPHASGLMEHYCRRWQTLELLQALKKSPPENHYLAGAQLANFQESGEKYLLLSVVKRSYPSQERQVGVLLGIEIDEKLREIIRFLNDPALPTANVGITCENCSIEHCAVRAAPPVAVEKRKRKREILEALERLQRMG